MSGRANEKPQPAMRRAEWGLHRGCEGSWEQPSHRLFRPNAERESMDLPPRNLNRKPSL
jgi:hypothetical protein